MDACKGVDVWTIRSIRQTDIDEIPMQRLFLTSFSLRCKHPKIGKHRFGIVHDHWNLATKCIIAVGLHLFNGLLKSNIERDIRHFEVIADSGLPYSPAYLGRGATPPQLAVVLLARWRCDFRGVLG